MQKNISSIKSAIEPKEVEKILKTELQKLSGNLPATEQEKYLKDNFNIIISNITARYEVIFNELLRKLVSDIEHDNAGPDDQQEKAVCLYLEIRALRKETTTVDDIPEGFKYTRKNLISHIVNLTIQLCLNHLLIPMSNYLESNYIDTFVERSIFPPAVLELMTELARDNCEIVNCTEENITDIPSSPTYIKAGTQIWNNTPAFSLRYNGFQSPYDFKSHLNRLSENFKLYIKSTREIIRDIEKLEIFYIYVLEHLGLLKQSFSVYNPNNQNFEESNSLMIRQETNNLYQDNMSDMFKDTVCTFHSKKLHRMMDLQYRTLITSINFIKSEYTILKKKKEILQNNNPDSTKNKIMLQVRADKFYFLIRIMVEEKIISENVVASLFRKVSDSFRTINQKELSIESMRNRYYSADKKCADFWVEKFTHMKQRAIGVRDGGKWG